ncbi:MAG: helix-turn-helix domain-containing protein [Clostridia bacterium]|nr:helix-turn-helix domain-containing protein [Clostridia bacterium]
MIDVAVPLLYDDTILGYIILGQMKTNTDFSSVKKYLSELGLDLAEVEGYYTELAYFDYDRTQSIANIATMLAKYILLENMLKPELNRNIEKAVAFINENLDKALTVQSISKGINVSKSVLYKDFHTYFGCTVSQYINTRRIEKSIDLLVRTDLSVEEISQKTGFSSAAYYSRIFKKQKGIAPLKFRKTQLP